MVVGLSESQFVIIIHVGDKKNWWSLDDIKSYFKFIIRITTSENKKKK